MIHEAIDTVEAVIWGAVISFAVIAAGAAFLITALGYWTGVLTIWISRRITHRTHPTHAQPEPATDDEPEAEADDGLYAHWNAWTTHPRKEKP